MAINIGATLDQLIQTNGDPVVKTQLNNYAVYWYNSINPQTATLYYIENNQVVLISTNIKNPQTLNDFIDRYKAPETSFSYYPESAQDSLRQSIHVWPSTGLAVITSGESVDSPATRQQKFAPTTLDEYSQTLGANWSSNQQFVPFGLAEVELVSTPTTTNQPFPSLSPTSPIIILAISALLAIIALVVGLIIFIKKRRTAKTVDFLQ